MYYLFMYMYNDYVPTVQVLNKLFVLFCSVITECIHMFVCAFIAHPLDPKEDKNAFIQLKVLFKMKHLY
jgi:hypothetical protein